MWLSIQRALLELPDESLLRALHLQTCWQNEKHDLSAQPKSFDSAFVRSIQATSIASVSNKTNVDLGVEPRSLTLITNRMTTSIDVLCKYKV